MRLRSAAAIQTRESQIDYDYDDDDDDEPKATQSSWQWGEFWAPFSLAGSGRRGVGAEPVAVDDAGEAHEGFQIRWFNQIGVGAEVVGAVDVVGEEG